MFDQYANKHKDKQNKNPFTSGLNIEKQKFSKDEYGRSVFKINIINKNIIFYDTFFKINI